MRITLGNPFIRKGGGSVYDRPRADADRFEQRSNGRNSDAAIESLGFWRGHGVFADQAFPDVTVYI